MDTVTGEGALAAVRFPVQALDLVEYVAREAADQQIHCVLTFAGRLDAERLARAVRLTLDAEPVLGCRLVLDRRRPYWQRRPDLDRLPLFHLTEKPTADRLSAFVTTPTDPCVDPLVQAHLLRGAQDELCIKISHVAADAGGLLDYARLLAQTYDALGSRPRYRPTPNLYGSRSQRDVFRRLGPLGLLAALRQVMPPPAAWGIPAISRDLSQRQFLLRHVNAERVTAIRRYARREEVSVNDILLAAFYRALFTVLGPPPDVPLPVQVPANLRRYLPGGQAQAICNLAGSAYPAIRYEPSSSFESTLQQVHEAMVAVTSGMPGAGSALFVELLTRLPFALLLPYAQREIRRTHRTGRYHPFLSNMGIIDRGIVDFGTGRGDAGEIIGAYGIGPVLYPPAFLLGVSTFRGRMTLTTGVCTSAVDEALVSRLLDLFVAELPG